MGGVCDFKVHYGACYAAKDAVFPSKVETQCLTKAEYPRYICPTQIPHKCKFHWFAPEVPVLPVKVIGDDEASEDVGIFGHCDHWVGRDPKTGVCDLKVAYGACFA